MKTVITRRDTSSVRRAWIDFLETYGTFRHFYMTVEGQCPCSYVGNIDDLAIGDTSHYEGGFEAKKRVNTSL